MENKVKVPLEFDPKYYSGVFNNHTKILGFNPRYENGYFECKDFNADPYLEQIVHLGEVKEWNLRLYRFGHSTRFDRVCHDYLISFEAISQATLKYFFVDQQSYFVFAGFLILLLHL